MSSLPPFSRPYANWARTQIDGSRYQMENCVVAVTGGLIDSSTLGYFQVSTARLRYLSGDTSGGITYDTAQATAVKGSGGECKLGVMYWAPNSTLRDLLDTKRMVVLSIWTARLRGTPWALSGTFGHSVEVGGYFQDRSGVWRAWVMDPGHSLAEWEAWPLSLLINCANDRTGSETIHVLYTRDLTNVDRKVATDGAIRYSPSATATKVGKVTAGTNVRVITTVRGGAFYTGKGYTAWGWSQLGDHRYAMSKRVR